MPMESTAGEQSFNARSHRTMVEVTKSAAYQSMDRQSGHE